MENKINLENQLEVISKKGLTEIKGGVRPVYDYTSCPAGMTDCEELWAKTYNDGEYVGDDNYWSCGDEALLA